MPFNLLIFPLVGGYYFLIRFYFSRFLHQRLDRQKLLMNSTIAGIILLLLSFLIRSIFKDYAFYQSFSTWIPIDDKNNDVVLVSFLLGVVLAEVPNLILKITLGYDYMIYREIQKRGNDLEILLSLAMKKGDLISFSLKNNKVYVGYLLTLPKPSKMEYIAIVPVLSGFRDAATKRITFTTEYLDFFETGNPKDFHQAIQTNEVVSASKFDMQVYEEFLAKHHENGSNQEEDLPASQGLLGLIISKLISVLTDKGVK